MTKLSRKSRTWLCTVMLERVMVLPFLLLLLAESQPGSARSELIEGPRFTVEPANRVEFSNATGAQIECQASGRPPPHISWVLQDNIPAKDLAGLRQVLDDGTLVFPPFKAEDYRQDVHTVVYRCVASNAIGTIISRDVHVRAVMTHIYDIQVYDAFVIKGNTGVLKCHIPSFLTDYVKVSAWIRDGAFKIETSADDGKYVMVLTKGDLLIRDVGHRDAGSTYRCQTVHRLTGDMRLSTTAGRLFVTDPQGNVPPRVLDPTPALRVSAGETAVLACPAQGYPFPTVTWYIKDLIGHLVPVPSNLRYSFNNEVLTIRNSQALDSAMYVCVASNIIGSAKAETELTVIVPFAVRIQPQVSIISVGKPTTLHCIISGSPVTSVNWLKNGSPVPTTRVGLLSREIIRFSQTEAEDRGMYQCIIRNDVASAQASAELRLGETYPEIRQAFKSSALQPGQSVSLQCIVSGSPAPQITWKLDDTIIGPSSNGRRIQEMVNPEGESVSTLSYQHVKTEDGGLYTCAGSNRLGTVEHQTRLNIYGAPAVRKVPKKTVVAGETALINCPMYGYPIDSVLWERDGEILPVNLRQSVLPNGTLVLKDVHRGIDSGTYICIVGNKHGQTSKGTVDIAVMISPKIIPFSFHEEYVLEGNQARVMCGLVEGDHPIQFSWHLNGKPIIMGMETDIRRIDELSTLLTINRVSSKHRGNYTCVARNKASESQYSAELRVYVPPKIVPFTFQDEHLLEGMLVRVSCVVSRGDLPLTIAWLKDGEEIPPDPSVSVRVLDEYSSVLSIDTVTARYNGNYTCTARNAAATVSYTAQLQVNVPPRWTVTPTNTSVYAGQDASFHCQAEGYPKPTITWLRAEGPDSKDFSHHLDNSLDYRLYSNGTLLISSTRTQHRGYYSCKVSNGVGVGLSRVVYLTVHVPPMMEFKHRNQTGRLGEAMSLQCIVVGEKPLAFTWKLDGEVLDFAKSRYEVKEFDLQNKIISELTIKKVLREDSSTYICFSQNDFGHDDAEFHLKIQEPPSPPVDMKLNDAGNRTAKVSWKPAFDGNSRILSYIIQYKEMTGGNWKESSRNVTIDGQENSAIVSGLKPSTKYQFRLYAENDLGRSEAGKPSEILMSEEAPTGPPQFVKVDSSDEKTLKVSWKPPRTDQWNGNIRGYFIGYKVAGSTEPFTFRLLEVPEDYKEGLSFLLTDLKKYTQYSVVVQALNNGGKGPISDEVFAMTSEGIPAKPPLDVRCSVLTSQSIHVTWHAPPTPSMNGILRGYKVLYRPTDDWFDTARTVSKSVTQSKITLQHLEKFTNYSIQVLAFTKRGDGVKSEAIYCRTLEDVPDSPSDIKALSASADSVLVSWKTPTRPNGIITKYYVYVRPAGENVNSQDKSKQAVPGNITLHEVVGLKKNNRYEFWVTAMTVAGEGASSRVVTQAPKDQTVAARLASFSDVIRTIHKHDIKLPCRAVGNPPPDRKWSLKEKPIKQTDRIRTLTDGALLIRDSQSSDKGNYTCRVDNGYGDDSVTYAVYVLAPPSTPIVEVLLATSTTIDVHWKGITDGGSPILRYILNFKQEHGNWIKFEIDSKEDSYQLKELRCGTLYYLYVLAQNKIGFSKPSSTIRTYTKGSTPAVPLKEKVFEESSTSVTVHLDSWRTEVCPIQHFVLEYRLRSAEKWTVVSDHIKPEQRTLVVRELLAAKRYRIRITAYNAAGSTPAEYEVATLTMAGGTIPPEVVTPEPRPGLMSFMDKRVLVPALVSLLVLLIIILFVCICLRMLRTKKKKNRKKKGLDNPAVHRSRPSSHRSSDHRSSGGHRHSKPESEEYADPSFTYLKGPMDNGTLSNASIDSQDDPAPYATVHLSDFQTPPRPSFGARLSNQEKSSPRKTTPAFEQALRIASGSIGPTGSSGSSDLLSFKSVQQQIPTAPPMSDAYGANSSYDPRGPSGRLRPPGNLENPKLSSSINGPLRHFQGHDSPREGAVETTFVFPNSCQGKQQGIPSHQIGFPGKGRGSDKNKLLPW